MAVINAIQLDTYRIELAEALSEGRIEEARRIAAELSPTRIASVLAEAPGDVVLPFLLGLDSRRAGVIFGALPTGFSADLVLHFTDEQLADLFSATPVDTAADVYRLLSEEQQERLDALLRPDILSRISGLAKYRPDTAGAMMTYDFIAIDRPTTVGEAINLIRSAPVEYEKTFYIYVVTPEGRPRGVVSLRDLIRYDPRQPVERAMTSEVIAVHVTDPAAEAARHIRNRRFMMLPVLDEQDVLVGVITFDDAMKVLVEEVAGGFVRLGGGTTDESFFTPPLGAVRKRLPWMAVNVFLNLGAVTVISAFEGTIVQVAILAAFLPMITDMGGNVGIQALSVAIRSIALGEVRLRDFWQAMRKEIVIGLANGLALGAMFGVIAFLLRGNIFLGLVAGVALGMNVLVAGVVGGTIPFLIKRLGKDPAMMTGPILTTITDITGVSIYLGLSTLLLAYIL